MESLIEYVYRNPGLGRENLATSVLAYILCFAKKEIVEGLLKSHGIPLSPSGYSIVAQKAGKDSRGIPDLQVQDEEDKTVAVIEIKFGAKFTPHQPNEYLKMIEPGGLLLFVVPEKRARGDIEELIKRCRTLDPRREPRLDGSNQVMIDGKTMAVVSWDTFLSSLTKSAERHSDKRTKSDVEQLRRYCEVSEKQPFLPLTNEQIGGVAVANLLSYLTWLTGTLIQKCKTAGIVENGYRIVNGNKKAVKDIEADSDSSLYFGQDLLIGGVRIWMGFYGAAWNKLQGSPLWISFSFKDDETERRIVKHLRKQFGEAAVIKERFDEPKEEILMRIPLNPDDSQDEAVGSAFQFVSTLRDAIGGGDASSAEGSAG